MTASKKCAVIMLSGLGLLLNVPWAPAQPASRPAQGQAERVILHPSGQEWPDQRIAAKDGSSGSQVAPPNSAEAPRPLVGRALDNLVAFTRLFGYVRHFHPSDEALAADWDRVAVTGVRAAESAPSPAELARKLTEVFEPLAPTVRVFPAGATPAGPAALQRPKDTSEVRVVAWEHHGFGTGASHSIYHSERISAKAKPGLFAGLFGKRKASDLPDPEKPFTADLGGGVSCLVPLAVWADDKGTIPHTDNAGPATSQPEVDYLGTERSTRLADIVLCWNVMQHFYPYFDVVETDWPAALRAALTTAATDPDESAFVRTLERLMAALHDGHGGVSYAGESWNCRLPLAWDWIEGQLVITAVDDEATAEAEVRVGDVVRKIGDRTAGDALAEVEQLVSAATPQFRRYGALGRLRSRPAAGAVEMELVRSGGDRHTATLRYEAGRQPVREPRPEKIAELQPGVFYVDIDRVTDKDFSTALPQLEAAQAIIFDFRGYPSSINPFLFFGHLLQEPATSPQWHVPTVTRPDREGWQFERSGEWFLVPASPYLKARKVFITDARAISYAESCLGIIEHYKLGPIVGGPTAGTNGNVNPFTLPGGFRVSWTGMKVLKQDGTQHHGVGILPTVPVERTLAGVRAGQDERLAKAIEVATSTQAE